MHMACFSSSKLHAHQHNTQRIIKTTPQASPSGRGSPFSGTVWSGLETEACWASWGRGWWAHNPARKPKLCHGTWGAKNTFSFLLHKRWTLTKSLRCRAQTRPSPPLLPGPQITSTEGVAFTREVSGYACKKKGGKTSKTEKILRSADWMFVHARLRAHSGDGCGTAESSQLHQLVHTEAILTEELLINVLGLLLPEDHKHYSLQSAMFFFVFVSGFFF